MRLWNRIRRLGRQRQFEEDLAEELRIHRAMAAEAGAEPGAFGSVALTMEDSRAVWRFPWLDSLVQDIRFALRGFRKSPGFALTVIGTLALGLGVLASGFSVYSATFLRPFAVRDPYSLYSFRWEAKGATHTPSTWREFLDLRRQKAVFSDVLALTGGSAPVMGESVGVRAVSGSYFSMLGGRACLGRPILTSDDGPGAPVAVLGHDAWQRGFDGDPKVVGRKLYVRGQPVEIVGVACQGFNGIELGPVGLWTSLAFAGTLQNGPDVFGPEEPAVLSVVGRFQPGIAQEGARAALLAYGRQTSAAWVKGHSWPEGLPPERVLLVSNATMARYAGGANGGALTKILVIFGAVLLIACANVSNMMLARGLARQREIGVRISLGAGRGRVVRQLLTESLLLALPAALAGFAVAAATVKVLMWWGSTQGRMGFHMDVSPDWRVLAFLLAVAVGAVLVFGLAPALQATRSSLVQANRGEFMGGYRPNRLRSALVALQVTVCAMLLISAAVALRGERRIAGQSVGYDPRGVFYVRVEKFRVQVAARLRSEPLVASACVFDPAAAFTNIEYYMTSPECFEVFGVPMLRGRDFSAAEADAGAPVAIVSGNAARRLWPGQDALGQTVPAETLSLPEGGGGAGISSRPALVIGVVPDAIYGFYQTGDQGRANTASVFSPIGQMTKLGADLLVRTRGQPAAGQRAIEAAVDQVSPGTAYAIRSVEEAFAMRTYPLRLLFAIAGFEGSLALLLTVSGIYGVLSYVVNQRKKEIGIRVALGAASGDVARMVLRQSLGLAAAGAAMGALLALGVTKVMIHSMPGMDTFDAGGFAGGVLVVIAAALAASWVPARRALKVDPAVTLRCD